MWDTLSPVLSCSNDFHFILKKVNYIPKKVRSIRRHSLLHRFLFRNNIQHPHYKGPWFCYFQQTVGVYSQNRSNTPINSVYLWRNNTSCTTASSLSRFHDHIQTPYSVGLLCALEELYDMLHLLTAIGLSPGGSSTVHIYTQTIHKTIQNKQYIEQHNNFGIVRAVPRLGQLYPGICLTTEEKAKKNLSQGSRV